MQDPVQIYHQVVRVLERHRRCFTPEMTDGAAFCSCGKWTHVEHSGEMEWHEHAAQKVAYALQKPTTSLS